MYFVSTKVESYLLFENVSVRSCSVKSSSSPSIARWKQTNNNNDCSPVHAKKQRTTMTAALSMRIVDADYYLTKPIDGLDPTYSSYRQDSIHTVPVIRIFGSTPKGQRTCLHIHGVLPYFYVPLPRHVVTDNNTQGFARQFAIGLDTAIQLALGRCV